MLMKNTARGAGAEIHTEKEASRQRAKDRLADAFGTRL